MTTTAGNWETKWAVRFFDKSASIFAGKSCVHLVIVRKNPHDLFRFLRWARVGRIVGPYESNKGVYYYRCTKSDEVYALKEAIWEQLSPGTQARWAEQDTILGQRKP